MFTPFRIKAAVNAEIPITAAPVGNGDKYMFLNIPLLSKSGVVMTACIAHTADTCVKTASGRPVIAGAAAKNFLVSFVVGDKERVYQYSYYDLIPGNNNGLIREFANLKLNITKCYIQCVDASGVNAGDSLYLTICADKVGTER